MQGGGAEEGPEQLPRLEYNWLGTDDQGRDVVARPDLPAFASRCCSAQP